jgi:plastocyanin
MSHGRRRTKLVAALGAATIAAGGLAALAAAATTTKSLSANPQGLLKYNVTSLTAKPGKVTLVMKNPSQLPHDVAIKGKGIKPAKGKVVTQGGTSRATATLKAGTYTFYCSVPGHEQAGMKGTLKVK